jgi:hypothetical protein
MHEPAGQHSVNSERHSQGKPAMPGACPKLMLELAVGD